MLYAAGTGYALRALAALPEDGGFVLARELGAGLNLPAPYLAKVLQDLASLGFLESAKGRGGGFRLARPRAEIRVGEVVEAFNAMDDRTCVMGMRACPALARPCPLHQAWREARLPLDQALAAITLEDLNVRDLPSPGAVPEHRRLGCRAGS